MSRGVLADQNIYDLLADRNATALALETSEDELSAKDAAYAALKIAIETAISDTDETNFADTMSDLQDALDEAEAVFNPA